MGDKQDANINAAKVVEKAGDAELTKLKTTTQGAKAAYLKWRDARENRINMQNAPDKTDSLMKVQTDNEKAAENLFKPIHGTHQTGVSAMKKHSRDLAGEIANLKAFEKDKKKRPGAIITAA